MLNLPFNFEITGEILLCRVFRVQHPTFTIQIRSNRIFRARVHGIVTRVTSARRASAEPSRIPRLEGLL